MTNVLTEATARHQAGQWADAARLYLSILACGPDNPEALHLLGVLRHQQGRHTQAIQLIDRACALRPAVAAYHAHLAEAHRALGQFDRAIDCCRTALCLQADCPEAMVNLGLALQGLGRHAEAVEHFRSALRLHPNSPPIHNALGLALRQLGRADEALTSFRRAVDVARNRSSAQASLGRLLLEQGRAAEALPHCREAVRLAPQAAFLHHQLGNALRDLGRPLEALAAYREAVCLDPEFARARADLESLPVQQASLGDALPASSPQSPGEAAALVTVGIVDEEQGDLAEAENAFRAALRLEPTFPLAHARLARLLGSKLPDADRLALEERLADPRVLPQDRTLLLFALARVLDERGDYPRAAECARQANALNREWWRGRRQHSPECRGPFVEALRREFGPDFFARVAGGGLETRRPVFVFGLPRSGTTLIEQVLAGHPLVHGAGELSLAYQTFEGIPAALGRSDLPVECLPSLGAAALRRLALDYLRELDGEPEGPAERIVDKQPSNYLYAGLLAALFPRATFIHCRRDLRDVALSCWFSDFTNIPWASDAGEMASVFRLYLRLIAHWKKVLPVPVHEVRYEETVADLEGVARRLIASCGLDWDPACLEFHRAMRVVRTVSVAQVRRPVYTKSVARWKNYESHLADLFACLPRVDES